MLGLSPLSSAPLSALADVESGAGIAAASGTSVASATSQTLYAHGAGASTGTTSVTGTGASFALAVAASTATSVASGAIQGIKPIVATATGTTATSFKLGNLVPAAASATATATSSVISGVEARDVASTGQATSSIVGAWDGPSGGDAASSGDVVAAAVGRSFAEVQADATASTTVSGTAVAFATTAGVMTASSSASADTAIVLPMYGNGITQWYDQPTVEAVSAIVDGLVVRAGDAIADCTWLVESRMLSEGFTEAAAVTVSSSTVAGHAAIKGDAVALAEGTSTAVSVGLEDLYAASVGVAQVRTFVRAYSADGRQNKGVATTVSTAVGAGAYTVAPHYVTAYFESTAIAELYGESNTIKETVGTISTTSLAYSFRGERYDEVSAYRLHVNTLPGEVWVYIGDHHGG